MTEPRLAAPHDLPDPQEPELDLPPPRVPHPGANRETLIHWTFSVVFFTALLLIGVYFTK